MRKAKLKFDEIGSWSELKIEIVRAYAVEYSKIISKQQFIQYAYIDAFAGAGTHKSKTTGNIVPGTPAQVLSVTPAFNEYHFIELNPLKSDYLSQQYGQRSNVFVYTDDCNKVLINKVFPRVKYEDYKRGLCLLDPYGLHLNWEVIKTAGQMKSIEIFLNFPISDMKRNVIWDDPAGVRDADITRMNAFWGDESWREDTYTTEDNLFGFREKRNNRNIAEIFRERLKDEAGFSYVSAPFPMKNSNKATIYYLFFASQKKVAQNIASYILNKFSQKGQ